jgi:nucleotide-binding universal stress UspA family protein
MGFETETHVKFGSVVKTILSEAEACGAEIIAMSSHGMGGLTSMFYGSVAAGVLNRIDRPLLIIRTQNHA